MPELTPSQQEAIYTHDSNLIVVAGAGSGKTYVLVERYLALLDSYPDWQLNQLVAITFTQKAAQEMRDRVREALQHRLYNAEDDDQVKLWSKRLTSMDSARIDTIHALCASILRANAAEAGVDPGFEVLDEVEASLLLEDAVDDALRGLIAEGSPALELFREYDPASVHKMLAKFASHDLDELPADLMETWTAAWHDNASVCLRALQASDSFRNAAEWQPAGGWPTTDDKLYDIWRICWDALMVLQSSDELAAHLEALNRLSSTIKLTVGVAGAWGGKDVLAVAKDALRAIREAVRETLGLIGEPPGESDRRAAELLPHWCTAIRRVQEAYRNAKTVRAALDFDDLERLTREVLHEYPHVRERYCGKEFRHVLVDEFQDTNAVQWEIVQALASPELPGALFVVGDPKQSIYQFRGADVSVFESVRAQIGNHGVGREISLMRSFRTHHVLVRCFNSLFARILVRDENSPVAAYQTSLDTPMEAFREAAPSEHPALELILLETTPLKGEDNKAEKARRWEAREIARRLRGIVESRRLVYDKKSRDCRPAGYGDIAILFQALTSVTLYEDAFKQAGLPFVTIAGRGYYNRQEVWDMLNLLRALHNPVDALALTAALRSPMFSLSDDALLALRLWASEQPTGADSLWLWKALSGDNPYLPADEVARLQFAAACLDDLRRMAGRVTIWELLSEALERTGYLATLTGLPDGARRRGNVEKLLEKAQSSGRISLGAFSQYLKDLSDRETREGEASLEDEGAIKLMTVHKSKGLEFPVVVLADASYRNTSKDADALVYDVAVGLACKTYDHQQHKVEGATFAYKRAQWLLKAREEAERKRLLYVATTRAQDLLIVSGQTEMTKAGALGVNGWLEWLLDGLGCRDLEPLEHQSIAHDWGAVDVSFPALPEEDASDFSEDAVDVTEQASEAADRQQPAAAPEAPPLLAAVPVEEDAPARALTATQIADLGGAVYAGELDRAAFIQRWRRRVLYDAPSRIDPVIIRSGNVPASKIGDIVHKALRWWRPGTNEADLRQSLDAFAWEEGIVSVQMRSQVVNEAHRLMRQVLNSDIHRWMQNAAALYNEMPFVFQEGERMIHGVIDVLMRREDGVWVLLDYKTSFVAPYAAEAALAEHAQRYYLQVGVYATAARELLGINEVDVYIYYIRHGQTVKIPTHAWQSALDQLDAHISSLIGMDD